MELEYTTDQWYPIMHRLIGSFATAQQLIRRSPFSVGALSDSESSESWEEEAKPMAKLSKKFLDMKVSASSSQTPSKPPKSGKANRSVEKSRGNRPTEFKEEEAQVESGKENKVARVAAPTTADHYATAQKQLLSSVEQFPLGISISKVRS